MDSAPSDMEEDYELQTDEFRDYAQIASQQLKAFTRKVLTLEQSQGGATNIDDPL